MRSKRVKISEVPTRMTREKQKYFTSSLSNKKFSRLIPKLLTDVNKLNLKRLGLVLNATVGGAGGAFLTFRLVIKLRESCEIMRLTIPIILGNQIPSHAGTVPVSARFCPANKSK